MDLRQREHIETVVQATTYLPPPALPADRATHDAVIENSWRRCVHQYGLDPSRMQEARILTQTRLREHQQRIDDFARIARHGLESLYAQVAGLGYVVLLTDAQGVTVDYIGDARTDATCAMPACIWARNGARAARARARWARRWSLAKR